MCISPTDVKRSLSDHLAAYKVFLLNCDLEHIVSFSKLEGLGPSWIQSSIVMHFGFVHFVSDRYDAVRILW